MEKLYLILAALATLISSVVSLECYACLEQDNNHDKCVKTTKQCEQYQDSCVSYIRWGIPPYWTPHGERKYYLSKDCTTLRECKKKEIATKTTCKRDWYLDWDCVECCTGDLCNYYVTLGAGATQISMLTLGVCTAVACILQRIR
ncbi:hypothetical protein CAPTEDRAFT_171561 [Capitella teleta]|uniref:UPAR/Ly6 domain-containing protein n=1 Tax=Capitella teleta TaxID=283909 RepID=R7TDM4_CAPTE|nr:hypothetical protein CAPTEDRAFT_171561 [Capitella teleta]|eukprot:ELT89171.1 hypothetical protein CAPTEDRAFT_171561 [Capitella teleta]